MDKPLRKILNDLLGSEDFVRGSLEYDVPVGNEAPPIWHIVDKKHTDALRDYLERNEDWKESNE